MEKMIKITLSIFVMMLIGAGALLASALTSEPSEHSSATVQPVTVNELQNAPAYAISETDAKAIALGAANGAIAEIEIDDEDGRIAYAVTVTQNGIETEVKIDATTGEVLSTETEIDDEHAAEALKAVSDSINEEEAIRIAQEHADGSLDEVELIKEGERLIYSVELKNGAKKTEVKIDAETGAVASIGIEEDDDDEEEDDD